MKGGELMKKIVWPGLVAGFAMLIVGMIISFLMQWIFPSLAAEYASGLMRPWTDPLMTVFFLYPFILGIALAWAWNKSKSLFKGTPAQRGRAFGWSVVIISTIPGMFVTYTSFNISFLMVFGWLLNGIVYSLIAGCIFARMNK
jgi:hypothetical protein